MRLEPKAKPIRIRIKLGNSEFSSLDSVLENFSINELFPLFQDGRLERWLIQIGETKLAAQVKDMSPNCTHGDMRDYILFLSLFFDDVETSLKNQIQESTEWQVEKYLSNASISALKVIYRYTKGLNNINWQDTLDCILTRNNISSVFKDADLHGVYATDNEWGVKFADLVKSEEDYKTLFICIEEIIRAHPNYLNLLIGYYNVTKNDGYSWSEIFGKDGLDTILYWYYNTYFRDNCKQDWLTILQPLLSIETAKKMYRDSYEILNDKWGILFAKLISNNDDYRVVFDFLDEESKNILVPNNDIQTFYTEADKNGYKWMDAYKKDLSVSFAQLMYQKPYVKNVGIEWGVLFADLLKDWDKESASIESCLTEDSDNLSAFYARCIERGYEQARAKNDPWFYMTHSSDLPYIQKAIEEWDGNRKNFNKEIYNYTYLKTELAKQILDVLESIIEMRGKGGWDNPKYSHYKQFGFVEERDILIIVKKSRSRASEWNSNTYKCTWNFSNGDEAYLENLSAKGNRFASYVLGHGEMNFIEIAKQFVKQFLKARIISSASGAKKSFSQSSSKPLPNTQKQLIGKFLSNPGQFNVYDKSNLSDFLCCLSDIYEKSTRRVMMADYIDQEFRNLSREYGCEQIYLHSMAKYIAFKNNYGLIAELSPIRSIYPPAEYMCQFFEKGRTTNEMYTIVSTRIEKYTSLGEHIKFVVEHLDDKKFA